MRGVTITTSPKRHDSASESVLAFQWAFNHNLLIVLSTRKKVKIAGVVLRLLLFARALGGWGALTLVRRHGIHWRLDLREAVDLSIYLIGVFELGTVRAYRKYLQDGMVVLDIGANIGAHTLPMASRVGQQGQVFAFEPTEYAFEKLRANVALNPQLKERIEVFQMMLTSETETEKGTALPEQVYSSWPVGVRHTDLSHPFHCGELKSVTGAEKISLDRHLERAGIGHVDFVKLDVDGNEWQVLSGARKLFERDRPILLIEFASYLFDSCFWEFESLIGFLSGLGYRFVDVDSGFRYPPDAREIRNRIPEGVSRNVIAVADHEKAAV